MSCRVVSVSGTRICLEGGPRGPVEIFFDSHHGVEHWNVVAALAEYGLTVADIRAAQSQKEN